MTHNYSYRSVVQIYQRWCQFSDAWYELPQDLRESLYFRESKYQTLVVDENAYVDLLEHHDINVLHSYKRAIIEKNPCCICSLSSQFFAFFAHMDAIKIQPSRLGKRRFSPPFPRHDLDSVMPIESLKNVVSNSSVRCLHLSQMTANDAEIWIEAFSSQLEELYLENVPFGLKHAILVPDLRVLSIMHDGIRKGSNLINRFPFVNELPISTPKAFFKFRNLRSLTLGYGLFGSCLTCDGLDGCFDGNLSSLKSIQVFGGSGEPGELKKCGMLHRWKNCFTEMVCDHVDEENAAYRPNEYFYQAVPMSLTEYRALLKKSLELSMRKGSERLLRYQRKFGPYDDDFTPVEGTMAFPDMLVSSVALLFAGTSG
jgi:hypothetical protein